MVFIFFETEIEKSHVDMVFVSNLKMEATIATVLKTAAQMNLVFVSNLKSQVRFLSKLNLVLALFRHAKNDDKYAFAGRF